MEIDLEAIRKRDGDWKDDGSESDRNLAARDRRTLLDYIDELTGMTEQIAADVGVIKRICREQLAIVVPAESVPTVDEIEASLEENRIDDRRINQRAYRERKRENGAPR